MKTASTRTRMAFFMILASYYGVGLGLMGKEVFQKRVGSFL